MYTASLLTEKKIIMLNQHYHSRPYPNLIRLRLNRAKQAKNCVSHGNQRSISSIIESMSRDENQKKKNHIACAIYELSY